MLALTARLSVESAASVAHAHQGHPDQDQALFRGCDLTTSSLVRDTLKRLPAKLGASVFRCAALIEPYLMASQRAS